MMHDMIITYESQEGIGTHIVRTPRFHGLLAELMVTGGFWTVDEKYFIPRNQVINVEKYDAKS